MKSLSVMIGKILFAGSLVYWMWSSGKIDFGAIEVVWSKSEYIFYTLVTWSLMQVLGAARWWMLVNASGYSQKYLRVIQLHLTGVFFNTAMPGAVGGDLVKATYVYLDEPDLGKTRAMTSILMDRVLGLLGLFSLCGFVILLNYNLFQGSVALVSLALPVVGLFLFSIVFLLVALNGIEKVVGINFWMARDYPGSSTLLKISEAFLCYRHHRKSLVVSWLVSILIQGVALSYFGAVSAISLGDDLSFVLLALVFPLGTLVTVLPIAPGGLGVGHVAFDNLFNMVGLHSGATIFNVYILNMLILNLSGGVAYLLMKRRRKVAGGEGQVAHMG